ncbi:hypothetical protein LTR78_008073 [Recurvomyces mirabilis]|uniref:F-box domain-containing protein n=1 Tax=Recurvomyces mirabilis TaxID=574656 RepID=A0AAE0TRR5_9PEZI|nr:hypothetical protein LTR78_008073 [Recurvomyces mirabilis]KAK5150800.1 hypothetical protein LTS14_009864 [Recurvomyces mirabilis]
MFQGPSTPYPERLRTFSGFWNEHEATARQLAAIGHVYDRPPLEAIEEGSRCVTCSQFVRRESSIRALEGSLGHRRNQDGDYETGFGGFAFHFPNCERLQVKIPLDPQATLGGLHGGHRIGDLRERWEERSSRTTRSTTSNSEVLQTSPLFSLPTELRLEIYARILPQLDEVTDIVSLHRDSARVCTKTALTKANARDYSKANLLRCCKTIHDEALDILYTNRTYRFGSSKLLYLFLRNIGHHGRQQLRSVDICGPSREDAIAFSLLASCSKLRSLTLRWTRPTLLMPQARPIWVTDSVAALLEISGVHAVEFASDGPDVKSCLKEGSEDAAIVRAQLTRPKGESGSIRWVDGNMDV